jgi:ElaB/YqjD/DUF883 family membrane-anchored ribosome-binding protein
MNFEPETPAVESTEAIRQEIEGTRSAISEKLEALETQVMGTVQSARDTVEETVQAARDTVQSAKETVEETIESVKSSVAETVENVKDTFDIPAQVRRHPWPMVGGTFAFGFAVSYLIGRSVRAAAPRMARTFHDSFTAPKPQPPRYFTEPEAPASAPAKPSIFAGLMDTFGEEIKKAKGMAIGYGLAAARDLLKQQAPQLSEHIDEVAHRLTERLGGEQVPGPVFKAPAAEQY